VPNETKSETFEARRPRCPICEMRMIATETGGHQFQCLRCGYVGPPNPALVAE
jgi:tRNA(Ile2) C34 agmatinyltransferase TiaS